MSDCIVDVADTRLDALAVDDVMRVTDGPARPFVQATVVIMIHNGERVLADTLASILAQDNPRQFNVLAVCNGCTDTSSDIAQQFQDAMRHSGIEYRVINLKEGGRARSLNSVRGLIRGHMICIDQDARLSKNCVSGLIAALNAGRHFATPELRVVSNTSWIVAKYFEFWSGIPYVVKSPSTIGVYAVAASVWARLPPLPHIHSDDKFVRLATDVNSRTVVKGETYSVNAPQSLGSLIAARRRYAGGNAEIAALLRRSGVSDSDRFSGIVHYALRPDRVVSAAVFVAICLVAGVCRFTWMPFRRAA
jgi:hypothetical protein